MLRSAAQFVAVENPVLSARYRACPQYAARAFVASQHEPAFGSAAFRAGFERDVQRSTFHTGTDEVSLRLLLSGTGLTFSHVLSIL